LLNHPQFFSFIIIINSYPKCLKNLIDLIIKQSSLRGNCQIILLNNNHEKRLINLCSNIIDNYKDKKYQIEIININKPQTVNEIYNKIFDLIKGEIIVLTEANCYPDDNWLENIIKDFSNPEINIIAGKIYQTETKNIIKQISNLIHNIIGKSNFKWGNIFNGLIANLAVRKQFIQQQKSLDLTEVKQEEISFYYRILREVEAEITYNSSSIVYQLK
jgi:Glycosyl transferase family 2